MLFKVKDKKTGLERTVTPKAYAALGPKVYEKLGTVNDDGSEITGQQSPNSNPAQVSRSVKGAAPVVVRTQIVSPEKPFNDESPQLVTLSGDAENKSDEPAPTEVTQSVELPLKVKAKPGPKPKAKSISSNPDQDEK